MNSLNCVIIEDNLIDRLLLEEYLSHYPWLHIAAIFSNPIESLSYFKSNRADLLFIDVDMPGMSGVDFLKSFPGAPPCIFVTVHPEFAIDAFDIHAIDYVLKPVKPERLDKAIQRALELIEIKSKAIQYRMEFENDFLMIKEGSSISRVKIGDIIYLEALTNYTKVITAKKKYITLNNLKNFLDYLPGKKFMRIHRSFAVALDKVGGIDKNELIIGEQRLPLGKTYRQEVKKMMNNDPKDS